MGFSGSFCAFLFDRPEFRSRILEEKERDGEKKGKKDQKLMKEYRKIHFLLKVSPYFSGFPPPWESRFPPPLFSTPVHLPPLAIPLYSSYLFTSGRPGAGIAIPVARVSRVCLCQVRASSWHGTGMEYGRASIFLLSE